MIQHLFFDFDGVLCDSLHVFIDAYPTVQKKFNLPPMDLNALKHISLKDLLRQHKIGWWMQWRLVLSMRNEVKKRSAHLRSFPQIKETLQILKAKNVHLHILTSNDRSNVENFLHKFGINVFDSIHSSTALFGKHRKMKKILRQMKLSPKNIMYVGDEVRDIAAMKKIDVPIIAVSWGWNSDELLAKFQPTYLIHSPEELVKVMGV